MGRLRNLRIIRIPPDLTAEGEPMYQQQSSLKHSVCKASYETPKQRVQQYFMMQLSPRLVTSLGHQESEELSERDRNFSNCSSGESRIIFLPERSSIYQYRPEISAIIVKNQSRTRLLFAHPLLYNKKCIVHFENSHFKIKQKVLQATFH